MELLLVTQLLSRIEQERLLNVVALNVCGAEIKATARLSDSLEINILKDLFFRSFA